MSKITLVITVLALALAGAAKAAPQAPPKISTTSWVQTQGPVLAAAYSWEENSLQEPNVLYDHGKYRMWFHAGWNACHLGYAESTDGYHWTQNPEPLAVNGPNGEDACQEPSVTKYGKTYYLYFRSGSDLHVATSRDGLTWTTYPYPVLSADATTTFLVNTCAFVYRGHWTLLYETLGPGMRGPWYTTIADGNGPFSFVSRPPNTLADLSRGGTYGGPDFAQQGNTLFFHASAVTGSNLPTDIYAAHPRFGGGWTVDPQPIVARSQPWEVDQVADPSFVLGPNGLRLLFFDGVDNPNQTSSIGVATQATP